MKNYLLGKRRVARTHFKSLLIVSLLAGTSSAQQLPATLNESAALPALPELAQLPFVPVTPTTKWNAGQHAAWILGLRTRAPLMRDMPGSGLPAGLDQMPEFAPAQKPQIELTFVSPLMPSDVPEVTADIALPGPVEDSMVMPVQFVDDGFPQVPEQARSGNSTVQTLEPPTFVTHAFSESEPPRIGSGPIFAAPVPPLPLEDMAGTDSLLSVDVSGIDPNAVNTEDANSKKEESLIDGLVLPSAKPGVVHSLSDRAAKPESLKANVTLHEGFTPRIVEAPAVFKLSDDSKPLDTSAAEPSAPALVKSSSSKVAMAISDTDGGQSKLPGPASKTPAVGEVSSNKRTSLTTEKSLTKPPALAELHALTSPPPMLSLSDKQPADSKSVVTKLPEQSKPNATQLSLSDKPQAPATKPSDAVVTKVDALSIDQALAALDALPLADDASVAASRPLLVPKPKSSESVSQLLPPKMIAEESPATATPIVAAQKMKLPEPAVDRTAGTLAAPAVKTASASLPKIDLPDLADEDVNYSRVAAKLAQAVKQKFPDSRVRVSCNEDGLIVDGTVADSNEATKIMAFVRKTSLCPAADRLTCKR